MIRVCVVTLVLTFPCIGFGQTDSVQEFSNAYTILNWNSGGEVLVVDEGNNFICELSDQKEYIELFRCRPILTAKQAQSHVDEEMFDALVLRFENVKRELDEATLLALFPRPSCELYFGGFDQLDRSEWADSPPTLIGDAPPLEGGLPSIEDVETRSALIRDFGEGLGFTRDEVELIVQRLDARVNWTVKTLVEEGVLTKVSPRVFKIQAGCN